MRLDQVLGRVNHGTEDGSAVDGAVVGAHETEQAPHVRVDGDVLGRLQPRQLIDELRHKGLENGRHDDCLDSFG